MRENTDIAQDNRALGPDLPPTLHGSVRNRSGIIAQHGVSNAKPSIVDLILRLPETNF